MGEVDLGYVIWHYFKEKTLGSIFKKMLSNYYNFLVQALAITKQVICISVPPPIPVVNCKVVERRNIKISLDTRIKATISFNNQLSNLCKKNNIYFLNLDNKILNKRKRVKSKFINSDKTDHHYNFGAYSKLIIKELKLCNVLYALI